MALIGDQTPQPPQDSWVWPLAVDGFTRLRVLGPSGRYRLTGILSGGGQAYIWSAEDTWSGRQVAIKTPRPDGTFGSGQIAARRMIREARIMQSLGPHPHVMPLLDWGPDHLRHADQRPPADAMQARDPWLVLPLLRHSRLPDLLAAGPVDAPTWRTLTAGHAEGLVHLHRAKVVHRDLSPGNVLLTDDGPVLTDFGVAWAPQWVDEGTEQLMSTGLTRQAAGWTQDWHAPEVLHATIEQRPDRDPAYDVFTWGLFAATAAAGRHPWARTVGHVALESSERDRMTRDAPPFDRHELVPGDPRRTRLVLAALSPRPGDRPAAAELVDALRSGPPAAVPFPAMPFTAVPSPAPADAAAPPRSAPTTTDAVEPADSFGSADALAPAAGPAPAGPAGRGPARTAAPSLSGVARSWADPWAKAEGRRRRRWIAASLASLILLAAVGVYAYGRVTDDRTQRTLALSRELANESTSVLSGSPQVGQLLAAEAWKVAPTDEARYALRNAFANPARGAFLGHKQSVDALAYSPDGKVLATVSHDFTVRLWNRASHRQIGAAMTGHTAIIHSIAFSPDGRLLVTASDDRTVRIWVVATHKQIATLQGPQPTSRVVEMTAATFSPDGREVVTGDSDGILRFFDVATRRVSAAAVHAHTRSVEDLAFSADGRLLATSSADGYVRFWNPVGHQQQGTPIKLHAYTAQPTKPGSTKLYYGSQFAFSPDGKSILTGSGDGSSAVWSVATRTVTGRRLRDRTPGVDVIDVAYSPDGRSMALVAAGTVRVFDAATHERVGIRTCGSVNAMVFSPDGKTVTTAGDDFAARVWDVQTNLQIGSVLDAGADSAGNISVSRDGHYAAADGPGNTVALWNLAVTPPSVRLLKTGAITGVNQVVFSPDGKILASAAYESAQLWDVATGRELAVLPHSGVGFTFSVAFSPDGKTLATAFAADHDAVIRLWDVATRKQRGKTMISHDRSGYNQSPTYLAFSPDGRTLVITPGDTTAELFDVAGRRSLGRLSGGHSDLVGNAVFSHDGTLVATSGRDGIVQLWNAKTLNEVGPAFTVASGWINWVQFSPDDSMLATVGSDGAARLWDRASSRQIGEALAGPAAGSPSVVFSTDGNTLYTAGNDGALRRWNITRPRNLLGAVCAAAGRALTKAETQHHAPGETLPAACPAT